MIAKISLIDGSREVQVCAENFTHTEAEDIIQEYITLCDYDKEEPYVEQFISWANQKYANPNTPKSFWAKWT